mmetsp:Transcript_8846/g.20260  ORF Transcript_8846/g.20260 Transcript_8846/m.20260 type:complete len:85 (+) Transcript_8846:1839-2093(+)
MAPPTSEVTDAGASIGCGIECGEGLEGKTSGPSARCAARARSLRARATSIHNMPIGPSTGPAMATLRCCAMATFGAGDSAYSPH